MNSTQQYSSVTLAHAELDIMTNGNFISFNKISKYVAIYTSEESGPNQCPLWSG